MRLYLQLTKNKELIPFNYQPYLTGALHKWIGSENQEHDMLSLYSFSWLQNVSAIGKGINLTNESYFFISAFHESLIRVIVKGIINNPFVCFGSRVSDVQIVEDRVFNNPETFFVASPVFIKRRIDNQEKHITYDDKQCGIYMTETLKKKLCTASLSSDGIKVEFDETFSNPKTKIIYYNGIGNRTNLCSVVVEGTPEQIAFAWNVGIGNSTGVGFGALK